MQVCSGYSQLEFRMQQMLRQWECVDFLVDMSRPNEKSHLVTKVLRWQFVLGISCLLFPRVMVLTPVKRSVCD